MTNYGMSQAEWHRYALVVDLAVRVHEPAYGSFVHSDEEPPLSPEEEEALLFGSASFGGQDALF